MQSTTVYLLDAWKKKRGLTSDNQAALALGISRQAVSSYRHGKSHADVVIAEKMATDLGMEVIEILAAIQADREPRDAAAAVWRRYGKPAFIGLLAGVAMSIPTPGDALGNVKNAHYGTAAKCETWQHNSLLCEVVPFADRVTS